MTLDSISRAGGPTAEAPAEPQRLHPSIALAPYIEALVIGRRLAVLGDVSLGLADALLSRGARLVHAYDPDPARVAEAIARKAPAFGSPAAGRPAARGVVHALLGDDLGVRDGAFDVVLIPDLCLFSDRGDAIRRARKLVAPAGAVVVAAPNPEAKRRLIEAAPSGAPALSYYEIFDLLSLQFPFVRMVGQAPFIGYAIVDFSPDREPDVTFDASLMSATEEPESFVAIAGDRPVAIDPYVVIEVPSAAVLERAEAPAQPAEARPAEPRKPAEHETRLARLEVEVEDLRAQRNELERHIETARANAEKAEARARAAAEEAEARARAAAAEAEARAREAAEEAAEREREAEKQAERWRDLEARAGDEHVRAERLTHKVRDLEEELVRQRDRSQKITKQLDDEKRARQRAEIELGMARGLARPELDESTVARIEELADALRHSKSHADSLASELLAKSKETAELRREHEAAALRITGLERALQGAQTKIEDIEEEAQTLRRPHREAVPIAENLEAGMMTRLTKLEAVANTERQAAAEARRALELAERQREAAQERADKLQIALDQERLERKELVAAKATLEGEAIGYKRRIEQILAEREAEAGPEVSHLEAALRDRGQRIAALERDLRESERIGRELVAEIEALGRGPGGDGDGGGDGGGRARGAGNGAEGVRAASAVAPAVQAAPVAPPPAPSRFDVLNADAFQHRIDALAADSAQKQAELLASTWKIQALERELTEARAVSADPSQAQRDLSNALVRAQSEIADLRRAIAQGGRDPAGVPRAVVEDAVLLHQQMAR